MTDEPTDLVLRLLQDIRGDVGDMKASLAGLDDRVAHIENDVGDLKLQFTYSLGLASGADFKAHAAAKAVSNAEKRMDELMARLEALEKA